MFSFCVSLSDALSLCDYVTLIADRWTWEWCEGEMMFIRENRSTPACCSAILSTTRSTKTALWMNPGLPGEKPETGIVRNSHTALPSKYMLSEIPTSCEVRIFRKEKLDCAILRTLLFIISMRMLTHITIIFHIKLCLSPKYLEKFYFPFS
jgi:hypothetical protein